METVPHCTPFSFFGLGFWSFIIFMSIEGNGDMGSVLACDLGNGFLVLELWMLEMVGWAYLFHLGSEACFGENGFLGFFRCCRLGNRFLGSLMLER